MARLAKQKVHAALEKAAQNILSAAGDDPVVSRRDIRQKLTSLDWPEKQLTSIFYRLIDHRDAKPGARVTKKDIYDTLAYAKEKLVEAYDVNNNGLSATEIAEMSLTARLAVRYARLQDQLNDSSSTDDQLEEQLRTLGEGLFFPAWANEADAYFSTFRQTAQLSSLNQENFREAVGLDLMDPAQAIGMWQQGRNNYEWIFENYENQDQLAALEQFKTLHTFMANQLTDLTHVIVGLDGRRQDSEYPVYFVGLSPSGEILGFKTTTVWT